MTERKSPFHVGELQAQARAGVAPPAGAGIRDFMPDQHRAFFAQLPFVLLGAIDDRGWPAASVLTGPPGFAASPDPWTLSIAAAPAPGDPLAHCLVAGRYLKPLARRLEPWRQVRYGDVNVHYKRHLDGGGSSFGQEYIPFLRDRGMPRQARVFEWCAGPGFIGFSLLGFGLCETLCLADVNPEALA